jgi:PAS domain S-box-containing protein
MKIPSSDCCETDNNLESATLRVKAEELLKKKVAEKTLVFSEVEAVLIHELEVHQIELEMQNEELIIANESARNSKDKYTELYDFAPSAYFTLSRAGEIIELNLTCAKMLGRNRGNLINSRFGFFVSDSTKSTYNQFLEKIFSGKSKETAEIILISNEKPSVVFITGITSENPENCLMNMIDKTERRHAEEDLRQANIFLQSIVDNIPNMVFIKDAEDLRFIRLNRAGEDLLGIPEQELLGKNDYDFFSKQQADFFIEKDREVLSSKKILDITEEPLQTKNQGMRILHTKKVPILNTLGKPEYLLGISEDITERKQAEVALRMSEEKYRNIFDNVQDVFYQIDKDGIIIEMSPSIARLSGFLREDVIGTSVASFYYDPLEREFLLKKIAQEREIWDYEVRLNTKSGVIKIASLNAHIVLNSENQQIGIEGSLRDITDRKRMEIDLIEAKEKAEESDRLKTAFLANMSHEIRTPLNGIIGFSEMLNDDDISKEDLKEFTSIIQISGRRLIEIVNNVLDVSQIQVGQVKIDIGPILLHSISSDLLGFFSPLAKSKNITLSYNNQLDNDKIILTSDETKLNQILTNLINNAIKFTVSGSIDFGYTVQDDMIQFYVNDTGIGIPEKLHGLIFERFAQAEDSFTRNYEGAGLGLAICKGLVELLGGKMWLESEEDKGSTFYFTLPMGK